MTQNNVDETIHTIHPAIEKLTERRNKLDSAIKSIEGLLATANGESFAEAAIKAIVDSCNSSQQEKVCNEVLLPLSDSEMIKNKKADRILELVSNAPTPKKIKRTKAAAKKAKRIPHEGSITAQVVTAVSHALGKKDKMLFAELLSSVQKKIEIEAKALSMILTKHKDIFVSHGRNEGWGLK